MKRFLIIILILFLNFPLCPAFGISISGGVSRNTVDTRFFGTWMVRGEVIGENYPKEFKFATSQIWNLWKNGNTITLENRLTGARGEVKVNKSLSSEDSAFLKFTNSDTHIYGDGTKIILTETPEITVRGNEFEGIDTFVVKKYRNDVLYKTEMVKYRITGKKISGY